MAKLVWVDKNFDVGFYNSKFVNKSGYILGNKALLNIVSLAKELGLTEDGLRYRLERLGYVETGRKLEDLSEDLYKSSNYTFGRPGLEKYPREIDCSSFVCGVYAEFGIDLPRYSIHQIEVGNKVVTSLPEISKLETGDLLFFDEAIDRRWESKSGIWVSHVMLYLGEERIIDVSSKNKPKAVMVRNIDDLAELGREHVATRRYLSSFRDLGHYENRTHLPMGDFEDLRERLINNNEEEK